MPETATHAPIAAPEMQPPDWVKRNEATTTTKQPKSRAGRKPITLTSEAPSSRAHRLTVRQMRL